MKRCPECLPGVLCLACMMSLSRRRAAEHDEEAETPVAARVDIRRMRGEKLAPTRVQRCALCSEPSQDCTCPPLTEALR